MIGYLSLGRDTFDIKYAKQKINIISKVLTKLDYKIYEFEKLILSQNDADKAIKFFKNNRHTSSYSRCNCHRAKNT